MELLRLLVLGLLCITVFAKTSSSKKDEEDNEETDEEDFNGILVKNKTNHAVMGFDNKTGIAVVYNSSMPEYKMTAMLLKLEERDEMDALVGDGDGAPSVHVIDNVEEMMYEVMGPEECSIAESRDGNITATCIDVNGTMAVVPTTSIGYNMAQVGGDGVLVLGGEESPIKSGQVRMSVIVQGWIWCCKDNSTSCEKCLIDKDKDDDEENLQIGSYLQVSLTLTTPDNRLREMSYFAFNKTRLTLKGSVQYGGGKGAGLLLPNQVNVDGKWGRIKSGFPKVENKDSKTMVSFACPVFTGSCRYDMVIVPSGGVTCQTSLLLSLFAFTVSFCFRFAILL